MPKLVSGAIEKIFESEDPPALARRSAFIPIDTGVAVRDFLIAIASSAISDVCQVRREGARDVALSGSRATGTTRDVDATFEISGGCTAQEPSWLEGADVALGV
ncbi:hypothetical protein GW17_00047983, partial [Ensete ventricosum]